MEQGRALGMQVTVPPEASVHCIGVLVLRQIIKYYRYGK